MDRGSVSFARPVTRTPGTTATGTVVRVMFSSGAVCPAGRANAVVIVVVPFAVTIIGRGRRAGGIFSGLVVTSVVPYVMDFTTYPSGRFTTLTRNSGGPLEGERLKTNESFIVCAR